MSYIINKTMEKGLTFEKTREKVETELKKEGFGILTEINIKSTFKKKLDVDVNNYVILGTCNPNYAYKALQEDSKLGVFLPCNVIIEEHENGDIEVSAINPIEAMKAVDNDTVEVFANEVLDKMKIIINNL